MQTNVCSLYLNTTYVIGESKQNERDDGSEPEHP